VAGCGAAARKSINVMSYNLLNLIRKLQYRGRRRNAGIGTTVRYLDADRRSIGRVMSMQDIFALAWLQHAIIRRISPKLKQRSDKRLLKAYTNGLVGSIGAQ
jgi:hypothetical protein